MSSGPNFRPRVIEPAAGLAVELEFHEPLAGLNGDTVIIYLRDGATFEEAQALVRQLHDLGDRVKISNPRR